MQNHNLVDYAANLGVWPWNTVMHDNGVFKYVSSEYRKTAGKALTVTVDGHTERKSLTGATVIAIGPRVPNGVGPLCSLEFLFTLEKVPTSGRAR